MCCDRCTLSMRLRCGRVDPWDALLSQAWLSGVSICCGSTVTKCGLSVWNPHVQPLGMWCASGSMEGLNGVVQASPSASSTKKADSISVALAVGGRSSWVHPRRDD